MADRTSPTESGVGSCCQLFPHNVSSPKPRLHNRGEWSVSGSCAAADDGRPGVSRGPGAVLVGNGGNPAFAAEPPANACIGRRRRWHTALFHIQGLYAPFSAPASLKSAGNGGG